METTIRQFQEEVRDILNQDAWFGDHGIDWLAEDSLDIEYEIKKHLGQTGMVAVVTTPELVYQGEAAKNATKQNYEEISGGWRTWDEQGREITVLTSGENQVTVSGGCFGSHSMVLTIGEESTEIVDDTEYVAIVTFENEIPKNVTMSTRTGNMIGKPFDHKLSWINIDKNLISDTGFAPSLSVPWSMEMMVHTSNNAEMYPVISTGDEFRVRLVANSNQLQGTYGNRTVTNNFGCFRDATGQMRAFNGANPAVYRSINPIKIGFSLNSSTTAANRIYNQGYFGDNCYSAPNGTNNAITVTEGFTLLLFGTDTGNFANYKFDGKFYYSRIFADGLLARDLYPVLFNGTIRIYDNVTGEFLVDIINTLTPDAGVNYEIDEDWEKITTDNSTVDFVETVKVVNKGFDATISLQIIENPTVNRGKPDKDAIATAIDVGHRAVYTLSGYDTEHYSDFSPSTIKQSTVAGAGGKLLQVDCRFTSTPVL